VAWASGRAAPAAGDVPSVMNYQGHLKDDSGVPLDGTYDMTFRIYSDVVTTAALWEETHAGVTVREGYFNVLLGYSTPLLEDQFAAPERYIGVTVAPYEEMTPRQRFASVPYAFYAGQADRAFGLSAADGDPADAVVVSNDGTLGVKGDYYGRGNVHLYAVQGEGETGTAYLKAWDPTDSSNIDMAFYTKEGAVDHEVMKLTSDGNVQVWGDLGVNGDVNGDLGVNGGLGVKGDYYGKGNVHLYAVEGEGLSGTAYLKAYDGTPDSNIDMAFYTKEGAGGHEVMKLTSDGNVQVSGDLNVAGDITSYSFNDFEIPVPTSILSETAITLTSRYSSICVLWGEWTDGVHCRLGRTGTGYWELVSHSPYSSSGFDTWDCHASCLSW
jgi:hypothetical protein